MINSPELPFKMIGGQTQQVAIANRIMAIDRINHLVGDKFDLRKKTSEYRYLLDLEMYQRWYKNEPKDKPIDETFCQRSAEVIKAMEKDVVEIEKSLVGITEKVKNSFIQHEKLPLKVKEKEQCKSKTYQNKKENCSKKGFISSILKKWKKS